MPIYEFVCQDCDHTFEKIQSFSDTSVPICPQCAAEHVVRQVSRPAIHFKGSGWYITDSKESGKKPASDSADGSSSSAAKAQEGQTGKTSGDGSSAKSSDESTNKSGEQAKSKPSPASVD